MGSATNDTIDRDAITQLIYAYGAALDAGDVDAVMRCYTADARFRSGSHAVAGAGAIRQLVAEALRPGVGGLGEASTHAMANVVVDVDDDVATAVTQAVVFLRNGGSVTVRGLRYSDELVRRAEGWRVRNRVHEATWQAMMPATEVATIDELGDASRPIPTIPTADSHDR